MDIKKWFMKTFMFENYLENMRQENHQKIIKIINSSQCLTKEQKEELLIDINNKKKQFIKETQLKTL